MSFALVSEVSISLKLDMVAQKRPIVIKSEGSHRQHLVLWTQNGGLNCRKFQVAFF